MPLIELLAALALSTPLAVVACTASDVAMPHRSAACLRRRAAAPASSMQHLHWQLALPRLAPRAYLLLGSCVALLACLADGSVLVLVRRGTSPQN